MTRKGWSDTTLQRLGVAFEAGRYVFPIFNEAGESAGTVRYADDGTEPKMKADRGTTRDLWPRPEDVPGPYVVVFEGEPDAVSATELGYPAVAVPGTGKWRDDWPARLADGRDAVYYVADCDRVGRSQMKRAAEATDGADAFVIDIDQGRDDGYDVGDVLVDLGPAMTRRFLDSLIAQARPIQRHSPDTRTAVFIRGSEVRIRPVRFLWRPWLPLGKVTILAGAPGQGKSQLAAFMAAATTTAAFTEGDVTAPGNVVILTAEDDLADTVAPRLLAAGADMKRWEAIVMRRTMPHGVTADGLIKLPGDLDTLHARLHEGDVRLVVFDPVASFVGREHSTYVNQDVRDVLDPLVALAAHYGVAVVLVLHLNKGEGKTWATKIGESHAFQAIARTVVAVAPDPDDEDGDDGDDKIMAPTKANLVRRARGLALKFRMESTTVYDDDLTPVPTSMVVFTGHSSIAADDLLTDQTERGARREALDFLVDTLTVGAMESKPLQAAAKNAGVSWRTIQRYYREVCKSAKPATFQGNWVYELSDSITPQSSTHGGLQIGALSEDASAESAKLQSAMSGTVEADTSAYVEPPENLDGGGDGAHSDDEMEWYRRQRDAMLGEPWDDE